MINWHAVADWMQDNLENVRLPNPGESEIAANCPFCQSRGRSIDIKRHLQVNIHKRAAHCFRCDWAGSWLKMVADIEGSFTEAVLKLSQPYTVSSFSEQISKLQIQPPKTLQEIAQQLSLPEDYTPIRNLKSKSILYKQAVRYLKNREVPEWMITSGMFGIVPDVTRVYMLASEAYYQARSWLKDEEPKYLNPEYEVGETLGLWDSPGISDEIQMMDGPISIVEGLFSGIAEIRRGRPSIALLGKVAKPGQMRRLLHMDREFTMLLDPDAMENSWAIGELLHGAGKKVRIGLLTDGDPAEVDSYQTVEYSWSNFTKWKIRANRRVNS